MHGERILFFLCLPDGAFAHVAAWFLTRGRRRVAEITSTYVPAEGPPRQAAVHYPGWMLTTSEPDDESVALGLGSSEIVTNPVRNILDLHVAAPGFGYRVRFIASADRVLSDGPILGGDTPSAAMFGQAKGLYGAGGVQGLVEGEAVWEAFSFDLEAPSTTRFSRAWIFHDGCAMATPVPNSEVGGPLSVERAARGPFRDGTVSRRLRGDLPEGPFVFELGDRSWEVTARPLSDEPLIGVVPLSWRLERWWWARALPPWRWRLSAVHDAQGHRVGLHEEWIRAQPSAR